MTGVEFITAMYCSACTFEEPQPMSIEDAAYNLHEYKADGLEIPVTVTPLTFSRVWNLLYERDRKGDERA